MNRLRRPFHLIRDAHQRDPWIVVYFAVIVAAFVAIDVWRDKSVLSIVVSNIVFAALIAGFIAFEESWRQAHERADKLAKAHEGIGAELEELVNQIAVERVKVDKLEAALETSERYRAEREQELAEAYADRDLAEHRARIYDEQLANTPTTGRDIRVMCKAFGQDVHDTLHKPDGDVRALRIALLVEEMKEYLAAEQADNIVEIADGLADVVVIAYGTACAYGIDLDAVLAEVYRSNMSKVVDGEVIYNEMGKVTKPDTYSPPAVADVIGHMDGDPWSEVAA